MKPFLFIVLVMASSVTPLWAQQKFEYSFKVGDQYEWKQASKQTIKQTLPGMGDMVVNVAMEGGMHFHVVEVTDKGATIETTYTRLKLDSKSPMGNMTMDSESTGEETADKISKAVIGKKFSFQMTRLGNVEKVTGTENLYADIDKLGLDESAAVAAKQALQQTLSANSLKGSIQMCLIMYSAEKVKAGDTWKNSTPLAMNFPMEINNTWSLKKIDGSNARIEADGEVMTLDKDKPVTLPNGFKSKMDLTGKQALVGQVSIKSGWPTEIKVLSEIKGKLLLLAGGPIPSDMEVPMEINTESTYWITKK